VARPFEVDVALLCDYAAVEATGKQIFAGVYGAEVLFVADPAAWPQMWIVAALQPLTRKFEFEIRFMRPDGRALIKFTGTYEADQEPTISTRLIVPIQFAPVRFTGPGTYRIEVSEKDGQAIVAKPIEVAVGQHPSIASAKLTGTAIFDAEI